MCIQLAPRGVHPPLNKLAFELYAGALHGMLGGLILVSPSIHQFIADEWIKSVHQFINCEGH